MDYMCSGCFNDKGIKNYIESNGEKNIERCHLCGDLHDKKIKTKVLGHYITRRIEEYYDLVANQSYDNEDGVYRHWYSGREIEPLSISQILFEQDVFSTKCIRNIQDIIDYMGHVIGNEYMSDLIYCENDEIDADLSENNNEIERKITLWSHFKNSLKYSGRYFNESSKKTLEQLESSIKKFENEMLSGKVLFRIRKDVDIKRISTDSDIYKKCLLELAPAPAFKTRESRMSPRGISYMYLADDINTAIAENKVLVGDKILIGKFKTIQNLKIIDFAKEDIYRDSIFYEDFNIWQDRFLYEFQKEISMPNVGEDSLEYLPTQMLAEYIRKMGYEGIAYRSSLNSGINYVLFCGLTDQDFAKDNFAKEVSYNFRDFVDLIEATPSKILPQRIVYEKEDYFPIFTYSTENSKKKMQI